MPERSFEPLPEGKRALENYGLFIGINEFDERSGLADLRFAVNDAIALSYTLSQELLLIPAENLYLGLSGEPDGEVNAGRLGALREAGAHIFEANRLNLLDTIDELMGKATEEEALVFSSFASHGFEDASEAFIMPRDGRNRYIRETGISLQTIRDQLSRAAANKRILLVDACREAVEAGARGGRSLETGFVESLRASEGMALLLSCGPGEISWEFEQIRQGVFTHFLLEGLRGKARADRDTAYITLGSVFDYAARATRRWVEQTGAGKEQTPRQNIDSSAARIPLAIDPVQRRNIEALIGDDRLVGQVLESLRQAGEEAPEVIDGELVTAVEETLFALRRSGQVSAFQELLGHMDSLLGQGVPTYYPFFRTTWEQFQLRHGEGTVAMTEADPEAGNEADKEDFGVPEVVGEKEDPLEASWLAMRDALEQHLVEERWAAARETLAGAREMLAGSGAVELEGELGLLERRLVQAREEAFVAELERMRELADWDGVERLLSVAREDLWLAGSEAVSQLIGESRRQLADVQRYGQLLEAARRAVANGQVEAARRDLDRAERLRAEHELLVDSRQQAVAGTLADLERKGEIWLGQLSMWEASLARTPLEQMALRGRELRQLEVQRPAFEEARWSRRLTAARGQLETTWTALWAEELGRLQAMNDLAGMEAAWSDLEANERTGWVWVDMGALGGYREWMLAARSHEELLEKAELLVERGERAVAVSLLEGRWPDLEAYLTEERVQSVRARWEEWKRALEEQEHFEDLLASGREALAAGSLETAKEALEAAGDLAQARLTVEQREALAAMETEWAMAENERLETAMRAAWEGERMGEVARLWEQWAKWSGGLGKPNRLRLEFWRELRERAQLAFGVVQQAELMARNGRYPVALELLDSAQASFVELGWASRVEQLEGVRDGWLRSFRQTQMAEKKDVMEGLLEQQVEARKWGLARETVLQFRAQWDEEALPEEWLARIRAGSAEEWLDRAEAVRDKDLLESVESLLRQAVAWREAGWLPEGFRAPEALQQWRDDRLRAESQVAALERQLAEGAGAELEEALAAAERNPMVRGVKALRERWEAVNAAVARLQREQAEAQAALAAVEEDLAAGRYAEALEGLSAVPAVAFASAGKDPAALRDSIRREWERMERARLARLRYQGDKDALALAVERARKLPVEVDVREAEAWLAEARAVMERQRELQAKEGDAVELLAAWRGQLDRLRGFGLETARGVAESRIRVLEKQIEERAYWEERVAAFAAMLEAGRLEAFRHRFEVDPDWPARIGAEFGERWVALAARWREMQGNHLREEIGLALRADNPASARDQLRQAGRLMKRDGYDPAALGWTRADALVALWERGLERMEQARGMAEEGRYGRALDVLGEARALLREAGQTEALAETEELAAAWKRARERQAEGRQDELLASLVDRAGERMEEQLAGGRLFTEAGAEQWNRWLGDVEDAYKELLRARPELRKSVRGLQKRIEASTAVPAIIW